MSPIYTQTFRIRHYECDAYGHVNNANYLRLMQETTFNASAAAGYDLPHFAQTGRRWSIREVELEYLKPLRYGDVVHVGTWLTSAQTTCLRQQYHLSVGEQLFARGYIDWEYQDRADKRAIPIPQALLTAFAPQGIPTAEKSASLFPDLPPPPPEPFTITRHVEWQDVDDTFYVKPAVYLSYLEECGRQICLNYNWSMARMIKEGFAIVVRRHRLEYQQSASLNEELRLETWISDFRRAMGERHYRITRANDGALLARAHSLYVWINVQTGWPIRIPAEMKADFAPNISRS